MWKKIQKSILVNIHLLIGNFTRLNLHAAFNMNLTLSSDVILFRNDGDIYFGVYESDPFKIALVLLSITLSIFFLFPLFIAFIWYDYFGPHSERLILNRLISSMSVTALVYLIFVHFVDIARYIVGPFSGSITFSNKIIF